MKITFVPSLRSQRSMLSLSSGLGNWVTDNLQQKNIQVHFMSTCNSQLIRATPQIATLIAGHNRNWLSSEMARAILTLSSSIRAQRWLILGWEEGREGRKEGRKAGGGNCRKMDERRGDRPIVPKSSAGATCDGIWKQYLYELGDLR